MSVSGFQISMKETLATHKMEMIKDYVKLLQGKVLVR